MSATIELDVFSGRPNPSWTIDDQSIRSLVSMLDAEPRVDAAPPADGLGFRGFRVRLSDGARVRDIHVSGSIIQEGPQRFLDRGRTIEALILSTMPAAVRAEFADILPKP